MGPEREEDSGVGNGDGFSFAKGKIVGGDSTDADIVFRRDPENRSVPSIEALGQGGIIFQPYEKGISFYNTPEAPVEGYARDSNLEPGILGLFYVKTRDGSHYAKVRVMQGFKQTPKGSDFSYYWLHWAYQPDGSRNLEIEPGKKFPFPAEDFGVDRVTGREFRSN